MLSRRATAAPLTGSEVYIGPHDPEFDADATGGAVLSVDALCTNRDLPADLPFGGGHPELRLVEPLPSVARLSLPDGADRAVAPAAARAAVLAARVASVARPSVDCRRTAGGGGVARGAAAL